MAILRGYFLLKNCYDYFFSCTPDKNMILDNNLQVYSKPTWLRTTNDAMLMRVSVAVF